MLDVNSDNYMEAIMGKAVLEVHAQWCTPSELMFDILCELLEHSEVKHGRVDLDLALDIVEKLRIITIPTLIYFCNGKIVGHRVPSPIAETLYFGRKETREAVADDIRRLECLI